MNRPAHTLRRTGAFTLIEMIGILAIMTILAGIMTPNILHSIERAAVRAEGDNLHALGGVVALYLRDNSAMPSSTSPTWTTQLATYSSLSAADILTNKRQMTRLYVPDPTAANQRAMLLSSMRTGVALASAANISANFQTVWDWNENSGSAPASAGWGAWNANNIEYLVIERINLAPVYRTDLQTFTVTMNNKTPIAAAPPAAAVPATNTKYWVMLANGTRQTAVAQPVNSTVTITLSGLHPKDRIDLYRSTGVLDSSYVLSTNSKSFDFNGTNWIPQ